MAILYLQANLWRLHPEGTRVHMTEKGGSLQKGRYYLYYFMTQNSHYTGMIAS